MRVVSATYERIATSAGASLVEVERLSAQKEVALGTVASQASLAVLE